MPSTRTASRNGHDSHSRNGHDTPSSSHSRNSSRRSHSLAAETNRHVIRPAKRAVRSVTRSLPEWVPWAVGALGVCAIIYGLFQIESVRNFASDITEPIGDFLSGDEFDENGGYTPREYEDESDFGAGDFGSSASDRMRSRL